MKAWHCHLRPLHSSKVIVCASDFGLQAEEG
jgi:hypothetical protein